MNVPAPSPKPKWKLRWQPFIWVCFFNSLGLIASEEFYSQQQTESICKSELIFPSSLQPNYFFPEHSLCFHKAKENLHLQENFQEFHN